MASYFNISRRSLLSCAVTSILEAFITFATLCRNGALPCAVWNAASSSCLLMYWPSMSSQSA